MKVKILSSANQDLIDGYYFYNKIKSDLGAYFLDSLFSDIDSLEFYGGIHLIYLGKYHKLLSRRFPFTIYYKVKDNYQLPILTEKDEDGFYVVECPVFSGCYSQGKTMNEALKNIREVIDLCLEEKEN